MPVVDLQKLWDDALAALNERAFDRAVKKSSQIIKYTKKQQQQYAQLLSNVYHLLAVIDLQKNNLAGASKNLHTSLEQQENPDAYNTLSMLYMRRQEYARALESAEAAIRLNNRIPEYYLARAETLLALQEWQQAIAGFHAVAGFENQQGNVAYGLGRVYARQGEIESAVQQLRQAIHINPRVSDYYHELAKVYLDNAEYNDALQVLQLAQYNGIQTARLFTDQALLHERLNEIDKAHDMAVQALSLDATSITANLAMAKVLARKRDYEKAVKLLRPFLKKQTFDAMFRKDLYFAYAEYLDKLADPGAFQFYVTANRYAWDMVPGSESYLQKSRAHILHWKAVIDGAEQLLAAPLSTTRDLQRVFMVGFPRSGTTLLGTMLGLHSDIYVHHEEESLAAVLAKVEAENLLMDVQQHTARLLEIRAEYIQLSQQLRGDHSASVIIDKLPLNLLSIPAILGLFPEARFVLSVRHPCDACMSCFMQDFVINDYMSNFTSLDTSTEFYAEVMGLWNRYKKIFDLNCTQLRYEDLITDPQPAMQGLLEFLGVEWQPQVLSQQQRGSAGQFISTPSYRQIGRELNTDAMYRWQRYADEFAPYLQRLQPFIQQFGYSATD